MTPEELIRKRKRDELLKRANAAQPTTPTDGEQLLSENTKETLKAAGHWAGVIGKRAAELTQKGALVAAEKAKEVKAAVEARTAKNAEGRQKEEDDVDVNARSVLSSTLDEAQVSQIHQSMIVPHPAKSPGLLIPDGTGVAVMPVISWPSPGNVVLEGMEAGDVVAELIHVQPSGQTEMVMEPSDSRDSPAPEQKSNEPDANNSEPRATSDTHAASAKNEPPSRWPWIVGGVVAVALVAGATYVLQGKNDQSPLRTPAPVAPFATPAVPDQLPEVKEAPVEVPLPAVLPEQTRPEPTVEKPQPVAAPVVTAPAPIATQSMPSRKRASAPLPKKAPAPAAAQKNDWQQKASNDLDAWAEKSGIK
jgi:hypothetical protein